MSVIVFYASSIFLVTFLGGWLPTRSQFFTESRLHLLVALGAGLLLGMSFAHMIPESVELIPHNFGLWLLAGFLILLVLERFIMVHACDEHGCDYHTIGLAAFVGLTIHGLIEGAALASSLTVPGMAPLVLTAILSHKFPSGMALSSILRLSGRAHLESLAFVFGVSLSGPLGLLAAYWLLSSHGLTNAAGALLAMSAGTFIYIGACDLLPELHRSNTERNRKLLSFLAGVALSILSGYFMTVVEGH
jgi:zinc and cadmium transporter